MREAGDDQEERRGTTGVWGGGGAGRRARACATVVHDRGGEREREGHGEGTICEGTPQAGDVLVVSLTLTHSTICTRAGEGGRRVDAVLR